MKKILPKTLIIIIVFVSILSFNTAPVFAVEKLTESDITKIYKQFDNATRIKFYQTNIVTTDEMDITYESDYNFDFDNATISIDSHVEVINNVGTSVGADFTVNFDLQHRKVVYETADESIEFMANLFLKNIFYNSELKKINNGKQFRKKYLQNLIYADMTKKYNKKHRLYTVSFKVKDVELDDLKGDISLSWSFNKKYKTNKIRLTVKSNDDYFNDTIISNFEIK